MKKRKFKKVYIFLGAILLITIFTFIFFSIDNSSNILEFLQNMPIRNDVKDYELIATEKTKNGIMIYSVGTVNNGADNMYFVDMVKKLIIGYKWAGGGGHINRNIGESRNFVISIQLLNKDQNVTPTLFGICLNKNISKIIVATRQGTFNSTIYNGKNSYENLYVVSFGNNFYDSPYFHYKIQYKNGDIKNFILSGEICSNLQKGKQHYIYEDDLH